MSVQTASTSRELNQIIQGWKDEGLRVGFVPTMGALHKGHLSLVSLALENADRVVVSIFVNPAQFAPNEDFESYPRDTKSDLEQLAKAGAHLVYLPTEGDIYPDEQESDIKAGAASEGLETDFRPHFFDGVVNVVHRLFNHVQPDTAIFGEKDYQQLCVIREMVETQNMDIKIIGGPIVRDEHGLALSSRNTYLSDDELQIARQLNVIIKTSDTPEQDLRSAGFDKIDYVEKRWGRILAAAWVGKTRLIDNMICP